MRHHQVSILLLKSYSIIKREKEKKRNRERKREREKEGGGVEHRADVMGRSDLCIREKKASRKIQKNISA